MILITILTLIVAISLQNVPSSLSSLGTGNTNKLSPILIARITSIFFLFSAVLTYNVMSVESIGSGIGIYSGYYQVTSISQSIEIFMYIIGAFILMP